MYEAELEELLQARSQPPPLLRGEPREQRLHVLPQRRRHRQRVRRGRQRRRRLPRRVPPATPLPSPSPSTRLERARGPGFVDGAAAAPSAQALLERGLKGGLGCGLDWARADEGDSRQPRERRRRRLRRRAPQWSQLVAQKAHRVNLHDTN